MFVKYNGNNIHALGYVNDQSMKQGQSPQVVQGLQPGWNEFPKMIWDQNKDHPAIKKMLAKGTIELMSKQVKVNIIDKKTGKRKLVTRVVGSDDRPVRLKYFDEKTAVEIVKATWNRDMLQRWTDEETRHKVKRALEKQIAPLVNTSEDDEDRSEGNDDWEDEE